MDWPGGRCRGLAGLGEVWAPLTPPPHSLFLARPGQEPSTAHQYRLARGLAGLEGGGLGSPHPPFSLSLALPGQELSTAHQFGLAGGAGWLGGLVRGWLAGGLVGATLVVIGSHAAFHELESGEADELQMEPV
uniref:Uncharacterized protein n=1 Tax=Chelonoidis abingdonii TaxID=106734 RepID=A0A8C0G3V0_CHEAB